MSLRSGSMQLGDLLAPVRAELERVGSELVAELRGEEADLLPLVELAASFRGKQLRPALVLLAGRAVGALREEHVAVGKIIELLHTATLVHDDVLDGSALRRGRPTVWSSAGRDVATATGDLLFSRAFAELAANGDVGQVRVLSEAGSALALGELMQRADAWSAAVTVERYMHRCELKTARLFEAACRLGALQDGSPGDELAAFGRRIGLAFQLLDDVLDVTGPPERTGKPRGADLLDGTVTLPLILARERDRELGAVDLRELDGEAGAARVCDAIAATGALEEARARALEIAEAADAALPALPEDRREVFALVAAGVVDRYA